MTRFQRHVFICINERPAGHPKGCCARVGGAAVRERFREEIARRGLKGKIRANRALCLDLCESGVSVVVYPEQVWYGGVTVDDVPEIVERHLAGGEPVERLRVPDSYFARTPAEKLRDPFRPRRNAG